MVTILKHKGEQENVVWLKKVKNKNCWETIINWKITQTYAFTVKIWAFEYGAVPISNKVWNPVLSPLGQATFKVLWARLEGLRGFWKDSRCSGGSPTRKSAERDIFTCFHHPSKSKSTDTQSGASACPLTHSLIHSFSLSVFPFSPTHISIWNHQEQNKPVQLFRLGPVKPP